jgi:DNA-binding NarL/FixJ family response regulator
LPDGNGLALLRHVRQHELPLPVAVITGFSGENVDEAARLQPSALFSKPVNLAAILDWIRAVCPGIVG